MVDGITAASHPRVGDQYSLQGIEGVGGGGDSEDQLNNCAKFVILGREGKLAPHPPPVPLHVFW